MFTGTQIIECGGLDLTETTDAQTITGIYQKLSQALTKDVTIILNDCVYGTGKKASAFNVIAYKVAADSIIAIAGTIKLTISDEDVVVVGTV